MLIAYDTRQPFFSRELETLVQQMRNLAFRESRIEADLRRIVCTARQIPWMDEFGKAYYPLTRVEILDGMKNWEMIRDNFVKFFSFVK